MGVACPVGPSETEGVREEREKGGGVAEESGLTVKPGKSSLESAVVALAVVALAVMTLAVMTLAVVTLAVVTVMVGGVSDGDPVEKSSGREEVGSVTREENVGVKVGGALVESVGSLGSFAGRGGGGDAQ